jgi:hypothetical protein
MKRRPRRESGWGQRPPKSEEVDPILKNFGGQDESNLYILATRSEIFGHSLFITVLHFLLAPLYASFPATSFFKSSSVNSLTPRSSFSVSS